MVTISRTCVLCVRKEPYACIGSLCLEYCFMSLQLDCHSWSCEYCHLMPYCYCSYGNVSSPILKFGFNHTASSHMALRLQLTKQTAALVHAVSNAEGSSCGFPAAVLEPDELAPVWSDMTRGLTSQDASSADDLPSVPMKHLTCAPLQAESLPIEPIANFPTFQASWGTCSIKS